MEVHDGLTKGLKDLRIIAAAHALRVGFFVRKDSRHARPSPTSRASACRTAFRPCARSSRPCAPFWRRPDLTEKDIKPVLVPNVIRSADDFVSGAADTFYFAFGAPKVREVDVTVGGIRMTEIDDAGHAGRPQDRAVGLSHRRQSRAGLRRRREADEGLQLRQPAVHQRQGEGRLRLQVPRHAGEEQARSDRGAAGAARVLGRDVVYKKYDVPYHPGRAEILQGATISRPQDGASDRRRRVVDRARTSRRGNRRTHHRRRGGVRLHRVAQRRCLAPTSCRRC